MLSDAAKAAAAKNGQDFSAESFEKMKRQVFADPDVRAFLTAHQDQLTKESVDASFASLYEYCRQKGSHDKVISGYLPQLFMEGPNQDSFFGQPGQAAPGTKQQPSGGLS